MRKRWRTQTWTKKCAGLMQACHREVVIWPLSFLPAEFRCVALHTLANAPKPRATSPAPRPSRSARGLAGAAGAAGGAAAPLAGPGEARAGARGHWLAGMMVDRGGAALLAGRAAGCEERGRRGFGMEPWLASGSPVFP